MKTYHCKASKFKFFFEITCPLPEFIRNFSENHFGSQANLPSLRKYRTVVFLTGHVENDLNQQQYKC